MRDNEVADEMLNGDCRAMSRESLQGACPMEPELSELSSAIRVLAERVEMLVNYQRDVTRWLLIVVCVIALGRSALDLGNAMLKGYAAKAMEIEETK